MTIIYTVDAFDRVDELLVFEVEIPKEKLPEISRVMGWAEDDYNDFVAGLGGWNLTDQKVRAIEGIIGKKFYQEDLDFQISGGEI
jgi:hypothetical protein